MPTDADRIAQLEKQQGLQTEAIKRLVEGKFKGGADSAEAMLYTLNQDLRGHVEAVDFPKA